MWYFIAGLPSILGFIAFVVHQIARSQSRLNDLTALIVKKLRSTHRVAARPYQSANLTPRQIARLVQSDQGFRELLLREDRSLLGQIIRQTQVLNILIIALIFGFVVLGVLAFLAVKYIEESGKLRISGIQLSDEHEEARGLLVDTDTLKVTWHFDGEPRDIQVSLENPRTGSRTAPKTVGAATSMVEFERSEYRGVLEDRRPAGKNMVRVIVQTPKGAVFSREFRLEVGITIYGYRSDGWVYVSAIIDDSTSTLTNYWWIGDLIFRSKQTGKLEVTETEFRNPLFQARLAEYDQIDWNTFAMTYTGPDDRRKIRFNPAFVKEASGKKGSRDVPQEASSAATPIIRHAITIANNEELRKTIMDLLIQEDRKQCELAREQKKELSNAERSKALEKWVKLPARRGAITPPTTLQNRP